MATHNRCALIRYAYAWTAAPDMFCTDLPITYLDVVEFLSTGSLEVTIYGPCAV